MMTQIPLQSEYSLALNPLVLPISLAEFKRCFLDDDAPYFDDKFLTAIGNTVISVDDWTPITPDAKEEMKTAFG
jgi:hypothetical protein